MALKCFDSILQIADDRRIEKREVLKQVNGKVYIEQVVKLLSVFYFATKELESDDTASIAKVIPTILNALIELEEPMVILYIIAYNFFKF